MGSAQVQQSRLVRILHEDPDLAHRLDEREAILAARQTVGRLEIARPGPWRPVSLDEGKSLFGGLILDGLMVRELSVGSGTAAELLGSGDLVLPIDADETVPFVSPAVEWTILETTRIAWLDAPFAVALRRWPELGAALLERSQRRFQRLALSQAISQLTRVDERVLIQLWHLSERWGRVRPDGVVLPVRLMHRVLARLVGARRPSVTTAVGSLEKRGLITRLPEGGWLLHGSPPEALQRVAPQTSWKHTRTGAPGIERGTAGTVPNVANGLSPEAVENAARVSDALRRAALVRERSARVQAQVRARRGS